MFGAVNSQVHLGLKGAILAAMKMFFKSHCNTVFSSYEVGGDKASVYI